MTRSILLIARLTTFAACLAFAFPSGATDRNGGNDCFNSPSVDWGDAPENVDAYPGVTGKFPTCRQMSVVGTQEIPPGCPPRSTFPGITGHIFHRPTESGFNYWLGCYSDPGTGLPMGLDPDDEGKMNQPSQGSSFCRNQVTDCVEAAYGLTFDQDECAADGSDAGLLSSLEFPTCQMSTVMLSTSSCATSDRQVFLNILLDMNHDGDWNDAQLCEPDLCAYEWAVKNQLFTLPAGCGTITSPAFLVGPTPGPSWMRISISDEPVIEDYPWAGGAGDSGVIGGETEDYPASVEQAVPATSSSWGSVKAIYR